MAGVTMREGASAFGKFATNSWGVAVAVSKGWYPESDGGLKQAPEYVDDQSFGQMFLGQAEVGNFAVQDLSIATPAKYNSNEHVLEACAMGSPATVTISTSAAGQVTSWLHVIDLAASIDGLGITLAFDKKLYVDEVVSAKVYGFEMGADGSVMKETFKFMGTKPTNISSTNINSTVWGATYPALRNRIFTKNGTFRINAQSAGSLVAADAVAIETCQVTFSRPQDAPFVYGSDTIYEPADQGFPEISIAVTFPRMSTVSANSFYAGQRDGTVYKADLTFQGDFINSTDRYTFVYQFPHLEAQETSQLAQGANQIKPDAMFKSKLAASSPSGIATNRPLRIRRTMVNSVHAFA